MNETPSSTPTLTVRGTSALIASLRARLDGMEAKAAAVDAILRDHAALDLDAFDMLERRAAAEHTLDRLRAAVAADPADTPR